MILDYTIFNSIYWGDSDYESEENAKAKYALDETKKRIEKANKKQEEINNLAYEKGLIITDVLNIIKEDINQSYYNIFRYLNVNDLLWEAWKYSSFKNKGALSEIEKSHEESPECCKSLKDFETSYDFVLKIVKDRLIPDKYRDESILVRIINYSYSTSYEFTFKYKDVEFIICIPIFNHVNDKNYSELLSGYILRFNESEYCVGWGFSSVNPKEFQEKLEKWIDDKLEESKSNAIN